VATPYQHLVVLKQKVVDKEIIDKIRELKWEKDHERLKVHLPKFKKQLKGELRRKIKLSSMTHDLLLVLGLLVKDSTTILK
jgi:hypothetical protein